MKNSKLFAVRAAAALFMALVLCTIAAHRIEILLLTEVRSLAVPAAVTMEDGSTVTKVPAAAVYTGRDGKPCVMRLLSREGLWGREMYVEEMPVELSHEDYNFCFLKGDFEGQSLAVYPSRPLSDDETVRCAEE